MSICLLFLFLKFISQLLTNLFSIYSCFAEDVWLCLGHLIGCLAACRPDLSGQTTSIVDWRKSITDLIAMCSENCTHLLLTMQVARGFGGKGMALNDLRPRNTKWLALLTSLYTQVIVHYIAWHKENYDLQFMI